MWLVETNESRLFSASVGRRIFIKFPRKDEYKVNTHAHTTPNTTFAPFTLSVTVAVAVTVIDSFIHSLPCKTCFTHLTLLSSAVLALLPLMLFFVLSLHYVIIPTESDRERWREQQNIEKEISIESSMFVLIGIWIDKQRCIRFFIIF